MHILYRTAVSGLAAMLLATAVMGQNAMPPTSIEDIGLMHPGLADFPKGFLDPVALPDSLALLPPAPRADSAVQQADEAATDAAIAEREARKQRASDDAPLDWAQILPPFTSLVGIEITASNAPHANMLIRRAGSDAANATRRAKDAHQRIRPFAQRNLSSCTPQYEDVLRNDGSYPSGHSAMGWMVGLVLTQLAPDKADALLQRGYEFGQSRVVCLAHWQSDVEAGRLISSATFARLQSDPVYRAQLDLARAEIRQLRAHAEQKAEQTAE